MHPLIKKNKDKITIIPINRKIKIGDIVLFTNGKKYVVHRVYKTKDGYFQTFGDNCLFPDEVEPIENCLGLVVRVEKDGRTICLDSIISRAFGVFWIYLLPLRKLYKNYLKKFLKIKK